MSDAYGPHPALPIEESRVRLLNAIGSSEDVVYIRGYGNIGDDLIFAGARQLLSGVDYREISIHALAEHSGKLALLSGSGGWCNSYHAMPEYLRIAEAQFERVILLPSSFDPSLPDVRQALSQTKAKVFARELQSYHLIKDLCDVQLAHDCALYFDFHPYHRQGRGVLHAYRTDRESTGRSLPPGNNDLSVTCESLDEFLWTIARHELIRTDRAHITIAAAMLGKRVEYATSNYHKVPAIAEFSLTGLAINRVEQPDVTDRSKTFSQGVTTERAAEPVVYLNTRNEERKSHFTWLEQLGRARQEIESIVPAESSLIFVDENHWGREPVAEDRYVIPFLERNGAYWGAPPDDVTAIRELERLRQDGANFLIFAWPAFWWLEHYQAFNEHVRTHYRRIWNGERLIAFDLRPPLGG